MFATNLIRRLGLKLFVFVLVLAAAADASPQDYIAPAGNTGNQAAVIAKIKRNADQGIAEAQASLGAIYASGDGVPQDYVEAVNFFRKAADQGDADAQFNLGLMYANGNGVIRDHSEAADWYRKAADQGDPDALNSLGTIYYDGEGVPQDYIEAANWFRKAADQGDPDAQFNLGLMHANGNGITQDNVEASNWFRKAADQGHADALRELGLIYVNRIGVTQVHKEAAKGYQKAVDQGDPDVQYNLGMKYEYGDGVPQNYEEASTWLRKAADQADAKAHVDIAPLPGHQRSLEVSRINVAELEQSRPPVIDGELNDAVWQQASISSGFWNSVQNSQPTNQTDVLVMMDETYLYFGFRAFEDDIDSIQATRTVRDSGLGYDDSMTIQLDTFFNRRDISEFSVNSIGTQSDDPAGGRSSKIEWKGDWQGAAILTDYGWSSEFAIPFSILNYDEDTTKFGVNFKRYQSRTKEYTLWADITPQSLNEEMGQLTGLVPPSLAEKKVWSFMPFILAGKNIPNKKGNIKSTLVTAGIDIRYQPRPDLTGLAALNPDFSQVEEAVTDISFSYSEKSVDDNRPFFAEGASYFNPADDDDRYFYSNRVPDFDLGAKGFGRFGRMQFGALVTDAPDDRLDFAARTLFEVDETNSAIATAVATRQDDFDNVLLVAQYNGRQSSGLNYSIDVATTETSEVADPEEAPEGNGVYYQGSLGWKWDYFYINGSADKYDDSYFPANALLDDDLPGTKGVSVTTGFYQEMTHPILQVVDTYVGSNYRETDMGQKQQEKVYASGSVEFTNDMRVGLFVEDGPYRPVGDERGVFEPETNDDRYNSATVDFNTRSSKFSLGFQYDWGDLGGGPYKYYSGYGWWRPVNPLYLSLSLEREDSFGTSDQAVFVSSWDITPQSALAGRYIHSEGEKTYRLAYSYRPRRGLDIFVVYDTDTTEDYEFSVKLVKIF
jgi:TPR repeat protein